MIVPDVNPARAPRADARRNRARILVAAEAAFATHGATVPIDEIAREAGLGVGTLYRHFPTKEALLEAVFGSRLEQLLDDARRRADDPEPARALFEVIATVVEESTAKRDLFEALAGAGVDPKARFQEALAGLQQAMGVLLERAQDAGSVRPDIGIDDLFALIGGACSACANPHVSAANAQRLLAVILDGLRRPG